MTDGIIQELFKSHTDRLRIYEGMLVYTPADCSLLIKMLEQELIEKIKQEFPITTPFGHVINYKNLQRKLIGDNQQWK